MSFIDNINPFLGKKGELSLEQIKKLWVILVKNSATHVEQKAFLEWITKKRDNNDSQRKNYILNDNLIRNLFNLLLTDKNLIDFPSMNLNIYNCLKKLFEIINMKEGNLEFFEPLRVFRYDQLVGFKYFWAILTKCNNEEVNKSKK